MTDHMTRIRYCIGQLAEKADVHGFDWNQLEAVAREAIEAAVKEEREACAKVAADLFAGYEYSRDADYANAGREIADAIRKRGQ